MNIDDHRSRLNSFNSTAGKMTYVDEGNGPVIVLIHGLPTSSFLYRKVIPELTRAGYRVIAPDLLGYGASDKPKGYEIYSEENQGRRILELMDHLNVSDWTHVCHDVGGLWTWAMLDQRADDVEHLVLLNTIIYEEGFHPPMRFGKGLIGKWYSKLYNSALSKMMIKSTLKNGIANDKVIDDTMVEGHTKALKEGSQEAIYSFFSTTKNPFTNREELFSRLNMPVSVIWGTKDKILKWKPQAEKVKTGLRVSDDRIILIEEASHFLQEEAPDKLAQSILAVISKN